MREENKNTQNQNIRNQSTQNWNNMNDFEFEKLLQNSLEELPPEEIVKEVTPWGVAMNRIIGGLALTTLKINLFGLNYILPPIGCILYLLGFRALRKENIWFRAGWILSVLRAVYYFTWTLSCATVYRDLLETTEAGIVLGKVNTVLMFAVFLCLWRGILAVQKKAGVTKDAAAVMALIIWNIILYFLSYIEYSGFWLIVLMLVLYICIIRSLFTLSDEFEHAGYVIQIADSKIPDVTFGNGIMLVLVIGTICGYLFLHSYPMEWTKQETAEYVQGYENGEHKTGENEIEEVRIIKVKESLISLGFPEEMLDDLLLEDLLACEDAIRVVVKTEDIPLNDGREVEIKGLTENRTEVVYDVKEIRLTGVGVQLPAVEGKERWRLFHHFQWLVNPGFYGTEAIELWPAYRKDDYTGWEACSAVMGQVLYDEDGQTYTSRYYTLQKESYIPKLMLWERNRVEAVYGAFTMPKEGEHHRGYVSYEIMSLSKEENFYMIYSSMAYVHQKGWFQYPVNTAKDSAKVGNAWDEFVFQHVGHEFDPLDFY